MFNQNYIIMENSKEDKIKITLEFDNELDLVNFEEGLINAILTISRELAEGSSHNDLNPEAKGFFGIETAARILDDIRSRRWQLEMDKLMAVEDAKDSAKPSENGKESYDKSKLPNTHNPHALKPEAVN